MFPRVWVAERNGYSQSEGLEPHFDIFDNPDKIDEAMRSGEVDGGNITPKT